MSVLVRTTQSNFSCAFTLFAVGEGAAPQGAQPEAGRLPAGGEAPEPGERHGGGFVHRR